jgi:hypothetical protein
LQTKHHPPPPRVQHRIDRNLRRLRQRSSPPLILLQITDDLISVVEKYPECRNETLVNNILEIVSQAPINGGGRSSRRNEYLDKLSVFASGTNPANISEAYLESLAQKIFSRPQVKKRIAAFFEATTAEVVNHTDSSVVVALWHRLTTSNNKHHSELAADTLAKLWIKKPELFTEAERDALLTFIKEVPPEKDKANDRKVSEFYQLRANVLKVVEELVKAGHPLVANSEFAQELASAFKIAEQQKSYMAKMWVRSRIFDILDAMPSSVAAHQVMGYPDPISYLLSMRETGVIYGFGRFNRKPPKNLMLNALRQAHISKELFAQGLKGMMENYGAKFLEEQITAARPDLPANAFEGTKTVTMYLPYAKELGVTLLNDAPPRPQFQPGSSDGTSGSGGINGGVDGQAARSAPTL